MGILDTRALKAKKFDIEQQGINLIKSTDTLKKRLKQLPTSSTILSRNLAALILEIN